MEEPESDRPCADRLGAEARRNSDRRVPVSEVDVSVGDRLRRCREGLGLSQADLARQSTVLLQQLQMYEWGADRVSPAHLCTLASVLGVPISYFFQVQEKN